MSRMNKSYTKYDGNGNLLGCGGVSLNNFESQTTLLLEEEENHGKVINFTKISQDFFMDDGNKPYSLDNANSIKKKIKTLDETLEKIKTLEETLKGKRREIKNAEQEKADAEKLLKRWRKLKTIGEIIFGISGFVGGFVFIAFCILQDFGSIKTIGGVLGAFAASAFMGTFFGILIELPINILISKKIKRLKDIKESKKQNVEEAQHELETIKKRLETLNRSYMEQLRGIQPPEKFDAAI